MKFGFWILDGHTPVFTEDITAWGKMFESKDRRVALTIVGTKRVSTVFLGIDHGFGDDGPPILFETMVFGDDEEYCERYATWEEAEAGHARAVEGLNHG